MAPFDRFMRAIACALCLGFFGASALAQSNSSAMVPAAKAVAAAAFLLPPGTATVALRLDPIDPSLIDSARRANSASVVKRLQIGVGRDVDPGLRVAAESLPWNAVAGGVAARLEVTSPGAMLTGLSGANSLAFRMRNGSGGFSRSSRQPAQGH